MCDVCHRHPCAHGCPNEEPPATVFICKYCEEPIEDGEDYFEIDGDHYHEDCFKDVAPSILLERYGATHGYAEVDTSFDED